MNAVDSAHRFYLRHVLEVAARLERERQAREACEMQREGALHEHVARVMRRREGN